MKKQLLFIPLLLFALNLNAQVGINTATPTKMLDINGNLRVRSIPDVTTQVVSNLFADATGVISTSTVSVSASGYTVGDIKKGFQSGDHQGWYLLDGRSVNTLTGGQAGAASLGLTALPDARGRFLKTKSASETLGSVGGSNIRTLTQANLPLYNYTGTTSAAGSHAHNYTETGITTGTGYTIEAGPNYVFRYQINNRPTGAAGNHTHSASVDNEGGGIPLSILPKNVTVNTFIFLGN